MKNLSYIVILLCTVIVNCKKSNLALTSSSSYFPNLIGNKFTYKVTDSISNKTYSVNISVIRQTVLPNGLPTTIWTYTYPNSIDTNYVFSNRDSAVFYDKSKTAITNIYHFPLVVGAKWRNAFLGDSCKVVSSSSLSVQAGNFPDAYLIKETAFSPNYHLTKNQWYVPNVGVVKMNFREFNFGPVNAQLWELISYNLSTSSN